MSGHSAPAQPPRLEPPAWTTAFLAVFRHELRTYVYSPLTYIFQCGFVIALAVCIFLVGDFYVSDEASIRLLLVFLPWVGLVFVPALAMRAFAEGTGDRAMELLASLPLPDGAVVAGKFLAGFLILLLSLLYTAPFVVTVYYLGEPDTGTIIAGYLGAALFLAVFQAFALFAASFTREQVGSFVLAVAVLFALLLAGWDVIDRLVVSWLPAQVGRALIELSPKSMLDEYASGVIAFDKAVQQVLFAIVALAGATWNLRAKRKGLEWSRQARQRAGVLLMVGLGMGAAFAVSRPMSADVDMTEESEFTIDPGTRKVLESLPEGTTVSFYWSASQDNVPVYIQTHARRIGRLLERMAELSKGRLRVVHLDPEPDTDAELEAASKGVRRVPMSSGDSFYLGAAFEQGGRTGAIPYFDPRRGRQLEYDIAVALNGLSKDSVTKVGVLSPLLPSIAAKREREGLSFMAELKRAYDIAVIPFFSDTLPNDLDVLLVIDASVLKRSMLYSIDQFLMRGGRMIVMLDAYVRFNRPSNQVHPQPSSEINDISDLLLAYGVRFQGDKVIGDSNLASPVSTDDGTTLGFPYWMRLGESQLSQAHPVTAGLHDVLVAEPGALELSAAGAQPLMWTTKGSGSAKRAAFAHLAPRDLALEFAADGKSRVLAAYLPGPFPSAFDAPPAQSEASVHRREAAAGAGIFVVADVDWISDDFALQSTRMDQKVLVRPLNDNLALLLNMVEYASGDAALLSIRSRGRLERPFSRVSALFADSEARYHDKEAAISKRISDAEAEFSRRVAAAGITDVKHLPPAFLHDAERLERELLPMRKALRDIRREIREKVERLGTILIVLNLLAGPVLVLSFAGFARLWRAHVGRR